MRRGQNGSLVTGAGAAQIAALGAGVYTLDTLPDISFSDEYFRPQISEVKAEQKLKQYADAVRRSGGWAKWD